MREETKEEPRLDDQISLIDRKERRTFNIIDIAVKDFSNAIWRNGFLIGMGAGGALILLIISVLR